MTIEQHDWDPVAELGAQRRTASIGLEIDIGNGQLKSEFGGELPKPGCCALTQRAPVAGQQDHLPVHAISIGPRVSYC